MDFKLGLIGTEIENLKTVLYWVPESSIREFLRTVPLKQVNQRCQLALEHFFNLEDEKNGTADENNTDMWKVINVLPHLSPSEVTKNLAALGSIEKRVEVLLRLYVKGSLSKTGTDEVLNEPSVSSKLVNGVAKEELNCDNVPSTLDCSTSHSTDSSLSDDTNSSSDSIETVIMKKTNLISENGYGKNPANVPYEFVINKPTEFSIVLGRGVKKYTNLKNQTKSSTITSASVPNAVNNIQEPPNVNDAASGFDLISYLKSVTSATEPHILKYIKQSKIDVTKRPNEDTLNILVNELLDYTDEEDMDVKFVDSNIKSMCENARKRKSPVEFENELPRYEDEMSFTNHTKDDVIVFNSTNEIKLGPPVAQIDLVKEPISVDLSQSIDYENAVAGPSRVDTSAGNSVLEPVQKKAKIVDENFVIKLVQVFPDAEPNYIRDLCKNRIGNDQDFDEVISLILDSNGEYPRRPPRSASPELGLDPDEQYEMLKQILPDADPNFLRMKSEELSGHPNLMKVFIEEALEHRNYPTMKEFLRKQKISAQNTQYTTEFNVANFVQLFPDPETFFNDPNRKIQLEDKESQFYIKCFFRNRFPKMLANCLDQISRIKKPLDAEKEIAELSTNSKYQIGSKRKAVAMPKLSNIPLLQELAYIEHRTQILEYIDDQKERDEVERRDAIEMGLIDTCSCCYDEEVLLKDIYTCVNGCKFCKECVKKSTEVVIGDGKIEFPCLMNCSAEFSLQTLQQVLPPKMFSTLAQKRALAEVAAAGIPGLAQCPFCHFATILPDEDRIFKCLNADCMKESCRLCKEPSHIPLKCSEVEKDEEVKARTYIEDKMTEALIRECYKCKTKFIKTEGCNKMTCSCGAAMCYICRQPVTDYKHFNGMGGDQTHLCPLYSDNFVVNEHNVIKAAEQAKTEVDMSKLKYDPTTDLEELKKKQKKHPQPHPHAPPQYGHPRHGRHIHVPHQHAPLQVGPHQHAPLQVGPPLPHRPQERIPHQQARQQRTPHQRIPQRIPQRRAHRHDQPIDDVFAILNDLNRQLNGLNADQNQILHQGRGNNVPNGHHRQN